MFLIVTALIVVLILAYVVEGRAWLKRKPWAASFFAWIEPIEIALFKKSETMLVGRLLSVGGMIVSAYDAVAVFLPGLDLTPVTDRLLANVPQDMRGLVVGAMFAGLGWLISFLRKHTSKPLEIVELPDVLPAAVAAKVEEAEQVKVDAVAAVAEAKAEGTV